ncbi:nitroreductase family protein [Xylanimonas protaetiae]|uniref:Nitroreductase family protein n=1 Tax=Xylanimonas protaetiae TaxID=2509457 RepID=A0A4P6F158_9MICO|nr:nitroreductase family protein [Xylanimonas protaetiae]QAY69212.1 nitroreductase family protein [Xylanimonas protaetiae]
MEFQDVVRRRRMVRSFTDEPLTPEQVERVLGNAVRGPSAGFTQGWAFLVLESAADRERFWAAATPASSERDMTRWKAGLRRAPLLVVPMASRDAYLRRYAERDKAGARLVTPGAFTPEDQARWPVPYWHVDVGMASLLMLQTAVDLGLGACFFGIGGPERPAFHAAFGVPAEWEPTGVVAVGHPDEPARGAAGSPARRARRPLESVLHRGAW